MTVDLKREQQQIVERAIAAGLVSTVGDVVELGVQAIRMQLETAPDADSPQRLSKEERMRLLHEWAHSHPTGGRLLSDEDISRESIYAGRGL